MGMNIEFLMQARSRYVYQGQRTLAGMMLAKADTDDLVTCVEEAYGTYYGNKTGTPLDAVEKMIATKVDGGDSLPISNQESYQASLWLSQEGLAAMPNPMPRGFVLYIAKALHDTGHYATMTDALNDILTTKQFT